MKQGAEVVAVVVSAIMAAEVEELLVVALAAAEVTRPKEVTAVALQAHPAQKHQQQQNK